MSKRSIFLATVVAVAVIATIPVGTTGAVFGAPEFGAGSTITIESGSAPSVASAASALVHSPALTRADTGATTPASGSSSGAASGAPAPASSPAPSSTVSSQAPATSSVTDATAAHSLQGHTAHATPAVAPPRTAAPTPPAAPACEGMPSGATTGAPGHVDAAGVTGTTSADIASFAIAYDQIRVAHCLKPIPLANIRFSTCLEQRMFWMADDPSTNPASAWGHTNVAKRSDGVKIVGCDGDIAGGMSDTGATDAQEWWTSLDHRDSLYQPLYKGSTANICIAFAITHGGVPNDPYGFTRAAAYWENC